MTSPRASFPPGFSTQRLDPRGLPGGGDETSRHWKPPPAPSRPALPRGSRARGQETAEGGARGPGEGRSAAVTRRGGGEGSPAPLTRPGAAPGPSLRLSRSKSERGASGGRGKDLAPRLIRKPTGRQEMTHAEVVQVRAVTGSRESGPDSGGKGPERRSLVAWRLRSEQREWTRVPAPLGPRSRVTRPRPPPAPRPAPDSRGRGEDGRGPAARPTPPAGAPEALSTFLALARSVSGS